MLGRQPLSGGICETDDPCRAKMAPGQNLCILTTPGRDTKNHRCVCRHPDYRLQGATSTFEQCVLREGRNCGDLTWLEYNTQNAFVTATARAQNRFVGEIAGELKAEAASASTNSDSTVMKIAPARADVNVLLRSRPGETAATPLAALLDPLEPAFDRGHRLWNVLTVKTAFRVGLDPVCTDSSSAECRFMHIRSGGAADANRTEMSLTLYAGHRIALY